MVNWTNLDFFKKQFLGKSETFLVYEDIMVQH